MVTEGVTATELFRERLVSKFTKILFIESFFEVFFYKNGLKLFKNIYALVHSVTKFPIFIS